MTLTVGSLFSGIGGLELGLERAGMEVVFQVEIDSAASGVLRHHWPNVQRYTDVKEVTRDRLIADLGGRADVDVLCGGFPCQDVSLAGRRAGLAGQRSGLFHEFMRLAEELTPRWLVVENVPGLLSSNGGRDMGTVLGCLAELGYGFAYRVLDAQYMGVPQRRRRVFIVGHLGDPWSAPAQVLFEPDSGEGNPAASAEEGEEDAPGVGGGAEERGWAGHGHRRVVSALTSSDGGLDDNDAQAGHLIIGTGPATPNVAGTLGSNDQGGKRADLDNAGAYVIEQTLVGDGWGPDVARTLTAPQRGHHYDLDTENFVVEDTKEEPWALNAGQENIWEQGITPAITGSKGNPGAVTFRKVHRAHNAEDAETWEEGPVSNTLNTFDNLGDVRATQVIVHPIDLRQATRTKNDVGAGTPGTGFAEDGAPSYPVMTNAPPSASVDLAVRRLTPLECERLQGFPDLWTSATDVKDQKDSGRYKQLGNAVAVVCSEWIGRRMVDVAGRLAAQ